MVHLLGVTANPDNSWVIQVPRTFATGLEDAGRRCRFLVRDRDTKFTSSFDTVFASLGIEAIKTPVRSPPANAYAERWIRRVRAECVDQVRAALRRLRAIAFHAYEARPPPEDPRRDRRRAIHFSRETVDRGITEAPAPPLESSRGH